MRKLCDGWRERCKGTAHASFIRGGYRRDIVSNRVTRGWIEERR